MTTFINKDLTSSNVARSTPSERRLINEQSRGHRASARTPNTSSRRAPSRVHHNANSRDDQSSPDPDPYDNQSPDQSKGNSRYITPKRTPRHTKTRGFVTVGSFAADPVDPFNTASVPLTAATLHLLVYYQKVYYTTIWTDITSRLSARIDITHLPRCGTAGVITEALSNRNRMLCLLASTSGHMSTTVSSSLAFDVRATLTDYLAWGTESLRRELSAKSGVADPDMMMESLHLYLAAVRCRKTEAALAHREGVRTLMREIRRRRVCIDVAKVAMFALVDVEESVRMMQEMGWSENGSGECLWEDNNSNIQYAYC